jgi:hypothetical protein
MKDVPPTARPRSSTVSIDAQHDLSAYVLHLIDDHLTAMQGIRERMRHGGRADPGGRRSVALESISLAEQYASSLADALDAPFLGRDPLI